nr:uncharacterized protein LOC102457410 [Pelodiscus sinensis]|eukprot:XP_006113604.1 uncharacterized protein LOC102457410 [Pelodiscus sinensis]
MPTVLWNPSFLCLAFWAPDCDSPHDSSGRGGSCISNVMLSLIISGYVYIAGFLRKNSCSCAKLAEHLHCTRILAQINLQSSVRKRGFLCKSSDASYAEEAFLIKRAVWTGSQEILHKNWPPRKKRRWLLGHYVPGFIAHYFLLAGPPLLKAHTGCRCRAAASAQPAAPPCGSVLLHPGVPGCLLQRHPETLHPPPSSHTRAPSRPGGALSGTHHAGLGLKSRLSWTFGHRRNPFTILVPITARLIPSAAWSRCSRTRDIQPGPLNKSGPRLRSCAWAMSRPLRAKGQEPTPAPTMSTCTPSSARQQSKGPRWQWTPYCTPSWSGHLVWRKRTA